MRASDLRHTVTLEQRSTALDTFGGQLETWTAIGDFPAKVEPMTGRELYAARAVGVEVTHNVIMRYDPLLADPLTVAGYRVRYGTRIFDIHSVVNEEERDRMITLVCAEGLTRG